MRGMTKKNTIIILLILTVAAVAFALLLPKVPNPPSYHRFADNRSFFGIPKALDVLSNIPLAVLGAWGIFMCARNRRLRPENYVHGFLLLFFSTVMLTGIGSTLYHLNPNDTSILWDRIPLSVMFAAIYLAVLADRVSPKISGVLVVPAMAAGPISVLYWRWSELQGAGDLRLYGIVQLLPILLLPATLILRPRGWIKNGNLWMAFAWYAGAKLAEFQDRQIFEWTGLISGHTLKHIFAGIAVYCLLRICRFR
jgi:hypothetical protein